MKIGMIAELLRKPLHQSIERAAELGVRGVQIYALGNLMDLDHAALEDLRWFCAERNLEVSAVCGDLGGHGFARAEDQAEAIDKTMHVIDITAALASHVVTTHIGIVPGDTASRDYARMASALRAAGRYAALRDVVLAIETGPETADLLAQFLRDVDSPGVGVNLDPANLAMVHNADPVEAVKRLGKYIVHTHAKDGVHLRKCDPVRVYTAFAEGGFEELVKEGGDLFREVPLGEGQVDWPRYLAALREAGFDGYLTIEREVGADPGKDIRNAIAFLQSQIS